MKTELRFRKGFDWNRIAWGRPDSPMRPFCAYCCAYIPDEAVPFMIWDNDGNAASFCDACFEKWVVAAYE
jgi:hypothetical protein